MPVRRVAPLGSPCWIDLSTSDVDRSKQFYGAVFGWTFEDKGLMAMLTHPAGAFIGLWQPAAPLDTSSKNMGSRSTSI